MCNCENRFSCLTLGFIASLVIGVVTAFLQITAVIAVTPAFLWVTLGIAVVYLAANLFAARGGCCAAVSTVLAGILGTILFSVVLLGITFAATSVIGAIIVGLLLFFFSLTITATACLVKCKANCD